jgi:DNA-binding protein HU-beta
LALKAATKGELVDKLVEAVPELELTKKAAASIIDALPSVLVGLAKSHGKVTIPALGSFSVKNKPERKGRNPSTGAEITIAASKKLSFSAAKAAKDSI